MNIDLLCSLCETPGVPGHEDRVRALIANEIKGLFDTVEEDPMGSLHCVRKGKGKTPQKIMLLCHMDEIGFLVSHISEKGFLYLQSVGGSFPLPLRTQCSDPIGSSSTASNSPLISLEISARTRSS